jgi:O-antigen/teichoic acid export membrane protein
MKNPLRLRFVRDVAMTGGAQGIQAVCAMLGGILVARFLGPAAKGQLTVLIALGSMAVLLASLGVHQSSIYFLGRHKEDRDAIVSNNTLFALGGALVTTALLAAAGVAFHDQLLSGVPLTLFFAYLLAVPFNYVTEFVRRTILGTGKVSIYNVPDLAQGASLLFGTAIVILIFGKHVLPLAVLRVATEGMVAAFMLIYLWKVVRFRMQPSRKVLRQQVGYGVKNYASSLFWLFLFSSDALLVNHFLGNEQTGIYSVAVSLGLPITMFGSVIGTLVFQRVAADEDEATRVANTNRVVRVLIPVALALVAAVGVSAQWLIPALYGHAFDHATTALLLLLPGFFALAIETVVMNFLAGDGSPPIVYWGPFIGLVVNLGANLFVIPRWGINGAAVTSSVGYAVVLGLVLGYYLRWTHSRLGAVVLPRREDLRALLHSDAAPPTAAHLGAT